MPQPTNPKKISNTTLLLEMAQRLGLFRSQDRQPFFVHPTTGTASPLYSESFFGWFIQAAHKQLGLHPCSSQAGRVISQLDQQLRRSSNQEIVHTFSAKIAPRKYQIDLGHPNQTSLEITGREWKLTHHHQARFQRLETSEPFPIPEPTLAPLHQYLSQMYEISEDDAHKLSHWMAQSMLPNQTPPILMITGEACDEAVSQIRSIVDPASHTIIDLPINQKDLAQQAIENRVLAYSNSGEITQPKIDAFKAMYRGLAARLKQARRKFDRLYTVLTRPILIASQIKQQISNHQITIEINKWRPVAHSEILGPLLDVVVQIVGQPITYPEPRVMAMPRISNQSQIPQWANTS